MLRIVKRVKTICECYLLLVKNQIEYNYIFSSFLFHKGSQNEPFAMKQEPRVIVPHLNNQIKISIEPWPRQTPSKHAKQIFPRNNTMLSLAEMVLVISRYPLRLCILKLCVFVCLYQGLGKHVIDCIQ